MQPKISIVVLNWNGYRGTIECIESLKKVTYPNYEVVLVDNGSTDGSEEILREKFPDVPFIQTGENLGFAGGNNIGIRHALSNGADYVILLNNDTVVDKEFVTAMVRVAEADKSIGILTSKIYFYDRPDTIWYAGAIFNLKTGRSRHIGYNKKDKGQYNKVRETDRACGCSMMVSRKVCETVGLMNPEYFCYGEEVDWSLRVKNAGYRVVFVPNSKVWHKISGSTGGAGKGFYLYYSVRNHLRLINTYLPFKSKVMSIVRDMLVIGRHLFSIFTVGVNKGYGIKNLWFGVRDYYHGRFGKREL
ncbi:MAG: glycosyltransferase family 2 protein [Nitrospirota bacterium]